MRRFHTIIFSALCASQVLAQTKELKMALEASPRTFDPRFANDAFSQYVTDLTNCSLTSFDKDGNLIGQLASTWKWVDPKTLVVTLKEGIRYNDGSLLSAEDVVATYSYLQKPGASPLIGAFRKLSSVKSTGKNTVEFKLSEADSTFTDNLFIGIQPKQLMQEKMISDVKDLKSCGPFVLSKADINEIILVRNEKYSLGPLPKLERISIKTVKDERTRFSKLEKGELDLTQNNINRDQLKFIRKSHPNLVIESKEGLNVTYLGFNFKDKILANKDVRQAISLGINRKEMVQFLLQGMAEEANGFLTSGNPYRAVDLPASEYNLKKANELLDKAGFPKKAPNNLRFELTLKTTADVNRTNYAHAIAGNLQKIGVKVHVQSLEWGKFKSDVDQGLMQLWLLNWIGYKDPDIHRYALGSESVPPNGANRGWYKNSELDKILSEAYSSHEIEKRKPLYIKAQKIISDEMPYVFLWHEKNYVVFNKSVKGFEIYADGRYSSLAKVDKN